MNTKLVKLNPFQQLFDLPEEMQTLAYQSIIPIKSYFSGSEYDRLKAKYPQYWNIVGEFDPFFKKRNFFVNVGKVVIKFMGKPYRNYMFKRRYKKLVKVDGGALRKQMDAIWKK